MSDSFQANTIITLTTRVSLLADMSAHATGTVYVIIMLEDDGDGDDGKYWDVDGGDSWQASPTTYPTASYANHLWTYALPAAATSGHVGARLHVLFTDNQATPASETASSGSFTVPLSNIVFTSAGLVDANALAISGDTTAADNLELQYDTTGLAGDTFPATQAQIGAISVSGAFNNETSDSYVLTVGTQTANLYTDTVALDGVRHTHTSTGNAIDVEYETNVGSGSAVSAKITGYLQSTNDSVAVMAWDWVGAAWSQRETMGGQGAASNSVLDVNLLGSDTGTGSDKGRVRLQFYAASGLTSATLAIDQLLFGFNQSAGSYEGGAVWIDTTVTNTGTVVGVDGISTNPVSTLAAARTIALATNLKRFTVMSGSELTLADTYSGYLFEAHGAEIHLGGQDITDCHFFGAELDGIATAAGGEQHFHDCDFETTATVPENTTFDGCSFGGTLTLGEAGDFYLFSCNSRVAGSGTPTLDMGGAIGASNVSIRKFSGGWNITNIAAGDVMSIGGPDMGTITLGGADGTVDVRGVGKPVVDNRTGTPTLTHTGHLNTTIIDTVLTAAHDAGSWAASALTASDIDTELTSNHGAGAWTSGGLSGSNAVTVTLEEIDTTPIVGAVVSVYNATNTGATLDQDTSDSGGDTSFSMDPGTYQLRIVKSGVSFDQPSEIVVATDPDAFTINGTVVSTTAASSPDGCMVYGTLQYGITAHEGVTVKMHEVVRNPQVEDDVIMSGKLLTTTTDSAGYFEIEMAAGTKIVIAGILHTVELPDDSSYDVSGEWDD